MREERVIEVWSIMATCFHRDVACSVGAMRGRARAGRGRCGAYMVRIIEKQLENAANGSEIRSWSACVRISSRHLWRCRSRSARSSPQQLVIVLSCVGPHRPALGDIFARGDSGGAGAHPLVRLRRNFYEIECKSTSFKLDFINIAAKFCCYISELNFLSF